MNKTEREIIRLHEDVVFFQEALNFTAAQTGFSLRLIEKDYFCTVLLAHLAAAKDTPAVFRGGTCLAKVHAEFYRLSEDLPRSASFPCGRAAPRLQPVKAVRRECRLHIADKQCRGEDQD